MAFVLKRARRSIRRALSLPMRFPTSGFKIINSSEVVDEERFDPIQPKLGSGYGVSPYDINARLELSYSVI